MDGTFRESRRTRNNKGNDLEELIMIRKAVLIYDIRGATSSVIVEA